MRKINLSNSWKFLVVVLLIYFLVAILNYNVFVKSLVYFYGILIKIIPVFVIVFILMSLLNYFFTPKFIEKHFKDKGIKKWFFVIIGGILSTGAIYMWYPLLADLREKGFSSGLIACFLYNRAVKIPLLPLMIFYFSLKYVTILTLVMVFFSVIQGILIDKLMEV